jgi:hypothetical protein
LRHHALSLRVTALIKPMRHPGNNSRLAIKIRNTPMF